MWTKIKTKMIQTIGGQKFNLPLSGRQRTRCQEERVYHGMSAMVALEFRAAIVTRSMAFAYGIFVVDNCNS